ncbi:hypothetical protein D3C72_1821760 [compost metagenome]
MDGAAVACRKYVRSAGAHIVVDDDRSIVQHIDLTLQQLGVRAEADAENDEVGLVFAFIGHYGRHFAVLSLKGADLFPKCQINAVILQGLLNRCRKLGIQVFAQNPVLGIDQRHFLAVLLERFNQLDSDITGANHGDAFGLLGFLDDRVRVAVVFG